LNLAEPPKLVSRSCSKGYLQLCLQRWSERGLS